MQRLSSHKNTGNDSKVKQIGKKICKLLNINQRLLQKCTPFEACGCKVIQQMFAIFRGAKTKSGYFESKMDMVIKPDLNLHFVIKGTVRWFH